MGSYKCSSLPCCPAHSSYLPCEISYFMFEQIKCLYLCMYFSYARGYSRVRTWTTVVSSLQWTLVWGGRHQTLSEAAVQQHNGQSPQFTYLLSSASCLALYFRTRGSEKQNRVETCSIKCGGSSLLECCNAVIVVGKKVSVSPPCFLLSYLRVTLFLLF